VKFVALCKTGMHLQQNGISPVLPAEGRDFPSFRNNQL